LNKVAAGNMKVKRIKFIGIAKQDIHITEFAPKGYVLQDMKEKCRRKTVKPALCQQRNSLMQYVTVKLFRIEKFAL
jgi:hypothetical protein